jgi:hypothetical protein
MRAMFLAALATVAIGAAPAFGEEPAPTEAAAPTESAEAKADAPATAELAAADVSKPAAEEKIYLPAGFKVKKRGKFTLYCRKEDVMGTRFPVEKCYDEQGIRDYVLDQRENQKQVDQMRRICGSMEACGGGG